MAKLNRRNFLQLLGAAGLTPFLPTTMQARAAAASGSVSTSKALWASLYANANSPAGFVGLTRKMGLSNSAIQGVSARTIGVRLALTSTANNVASAGAKAARTPIASKGQGFKVRKIIERAFEKHFCDETDETQLELKEDAKELDVEETVANDSRAENMTKEVGQSKD